MSTNTNSKNTASPKAADEAPKKAKKAGVEIELEDVDTGKIKKVNAIINPLYPNVRVNKTRDAVVKAEAFIKLAEGKKLSDAEKNENPALADMKASEAKGIITKWASMGSNMVKLLSLVLLLMVTIGCQTGVAQQMRDGRFDSFALDTLTDVETKTWDMAREMIDYDPYDYTWHVTATNLTGTTAVSFIVQESLNPDGGDWVNVDTVAITDDYNNFISGTVTGARQRLQLVSSGTHTTSVKAWVRYRKKEDQ